MAPEKPQLVTEDSFAALIREFQQSSRWTQPPPVGLAENTKKGWARELRWLSDPGCLGALTIHEIKPSLVQAAFDGIADRPGKQGVALAVLKVLEAWAIVREKLPRQITLGVEIGSSTGGHIAWSDEHVGLAEREAPAFLSRAITLAAWTGQRGCDLIRMGPTDIELYRGLRGIVVTQRKTGKEVWIPITSELEAKMATWERRPGPFLLNAVGKPWRTENHLSSTWNYYREVRPALAPLLIDALRMHPSTAPRKDQGLVIHGLRGTACIRLRRAGATESQIADMVGMSVQMVARYCRTSAQRDNAVASIMHLDRTLGERSRDIVRKIGN